MYDCFKNQFLIKESEERNKIKEIINSFIPIYCQSKKYIYLNFLNKYIPQIKLFNYQKKNLHFNKIDNVKNKSSLFHLSLCVVLLLKTS